MTTARDLRAASPRELREHLVRGHPIDPGDLEGWVYRGTSLGLPGFIERLTWKTFQKTFWREPDTGRLLGWNVRLEQDGVDAPSRPKMRRGRPVTEWHYEVVDPAGAPLPRGFDRGLLIDYSLGHNPPGVTHFVKDPLVALRAGSADDLLGVSYLDLGGHTIETPTYFTLERERPVDWVPYTERVTPRVDPLRLTRAERAWAEAVFGAILATGGSEGLPAFESVDRTAFWRTFERAPAPLVRAGLRPMVHTLTFLPLAWGFGRPFFALSGPERARFIARAAGSRSYFVRQAVVTLKMLACFAYFEDPAVRGRYEAARAPGAAR